MLYGVIHGHSEFSVKDSALSVRKYLQTVKDLGGKGAVLTDHGVLTGIPDLVKEAPKVGIKGIPGIEFYVTRNPEVETRHHLIVIAKDYQGYQAIMRAATDAQRNLVNGFPCLKEERIPLFFGPGSCGHGHVFATSACVQGVLCSYFIRNIVLQEKMNKIVHKASTAKYQNPEDREYLAKKKMLEENDALISELDGKIESLKSMASKKFGNAERTIKAHQAKGMDVTEEVNAMNKEKELAEWAKEELEKLKKQKNEVISARRELVAYCSQAEKSHAKYLEAFNKVQELADSMKTEDDYLQEAVEKANWYADVFGRDNFYLEFQNHGLEMEEVAYPLLERVMDMTSLSPIASNDSHYATDSKNDIRGRWLVRSMRFNKAEKEDPLDGEYYIKTNEQLRGMLVKLVREDTADRALSNIEHVIDSCDVILPTELHFPKFNTGTEETATQYLRRMAENGIKIRYPMGEGWTEEHQKRLDYELQVIDELGYSDYLCIVEDFLREGRRLGKENPECVGMGVGPGRGSAAGSLVCYLAGITDIDPMRFNLLFERFLNKDRVSYPDIDSDFHTEIRGQVIEYVKGRYGEDGVCGIITHGTLAARNAIRSAARVLGTEEGADPKVFSSVADQLCSLVPQTPNIKLEDVKDALDQAASNNPVAEKILADARIIEGTVVQYGMHAAGIILADQGDVGEYVPLAYNADQNQWMSQYTGPDDEKLAKILKMDFLGLKNLDIITDTLKLIYHTQGVKLDMSEIGRTIKDGRTTAYDVCEGNCIDEIFAKGKTNGVFQFESSGMKQLLKRFKPQTINDIALLNAVYRPGPIQYIDRILDVRKSGKMPKQVLPELNNLLQDTYGYPVYQESVMRICHEIAGMTMGEADKIRWAMSKKHGEVLEEYHGRFVDGFVNAGADRNASEQYWMDLQSFAKYAFNKAHAVAYSFLAFYTAWLKYNYPVEYFTALLNHSASTKYESIISEIREMGIRILPPDICESSAEFTCTKDAIRFGLTSITGIKGAADAILRDRPSDGYADFKEFILSSGVSDSIVKSMIYAGCFDRFHKNRSVMAGMVERIRDAFKNYSKAKSEKESIENELKEADPDSKKYEKIKNKYEKAVAKELEMFKLFESQTVYPQIVDETPKRLAEYEREYLGVSLSWDPLQGYTDFSQYSEIEIAGASAGSDVKYCGVVSNVQIRKQKDGSPMANFTLSDRTGEINAVCFARSYAAYADLIQNGAVLVVSGKVREDTYRSTEEETVLQLLVNTCKAIEKRLPVLEVTYKDVGILKKHRDIFNIYSGSDYEVHLVNEENGKPMCFAGNPKVCVRNEILNLNIQGLKMRIIK